MKPASDSSAQGHLAEHGRSLYRRRAVEALNVSPGDTVVDRGCGTGANFPWLEHAVNASGRIVGVDLTDTMLLEARHRVESVE